MGVLLSYFIPQQIFQLSQKQLSTQQPAFIDAEDFGIGLSQFNLFAH